MPRRLAGSLFIAAMYGCSGESQEPLPQPTAHQYMLSWDTNIETNMREYRVYITHGIDAPEVYTILTHNAKLAHHLVNIPSQPACYYVTAINDVPLESEPSNMACL